MIYSMTGYGKASGSVNGKKVMVEVRTLNSKSLDLNLKYPPLFREKESELRNLVGEKLDRGKIDFWLMVDDMGESSTYTINKGLVASYYRQVLSISDELGAGKEDVLATILRMPEVVKPADENVNEGEWTQIRQIVGQALDKTMDFRRTEGKFLSKALEDHVAEIEKNLAGVKDYEPNRVQKLRDKLHRSLSEVIAEADIDKNRFEQEVIYYLEKYDISEEKVRLKSHCEYFLETLHAEGLNGKKLNFISQEMGREINTLGSKAYDADIQKLVVLMKDELEKIKEQVMNVL